MLIIIIVLLTILLCDNNSNSDITVNRGIKILLKVNYEISCLSLSILYIENTWLIFTIHCIEYTLSFKCQKNNSFNNATITILIAMCIIVYSF